MIDPLAQQVVAFGGPGLGALWMVLRYKPWQNGNGNGKSIRPTCVIADPQGSELHRIQIAKEVVSGLMPEMEKQTRILGEIRDAMLSGR